MFETLEAYLQEIRQYLPRKGGGDEIVAEIRSHILEKAERESGEATGESVHAIISSYGRPQDVAAQYAEGSEIIAPIFRRHLFRYTWILFALHAALTTIALSFDASIIMFPFFFIPRMPSWAALVYLPMAWLADFGIVALTLFIVTQKAGRPALPWPRILRVRRLEPPKPASLAWRVAILAGMVFLLVRYHTIFFYSLNLRPFESLMDPVSSIVLSIMFIAAIFCNAAAYAMRFVINSSWVLLAKDTVVLLILWSILNVPIAVRFKDVQGIDLRIYGGTFVIILITVTAVKLLRSLARVAGEIAIS
ncbi:MAG: hypothetical protein PHQ19_05640 [Candidatus Krumholzibacteria bacterium]|nr:hypothetical protein [Candidatus Krumholzibacteria bacterium]